MFNLRKFLGLCEHKWKYIRTEAGQYKIIDVQECKKCGLREGIHVW